MSHHQDIEIQNLRANVAALTRRVWLLELAAGTALAPPAPTPAAAPAHTTAAPQAPTVPPPVRRQPPARPAARQAPPHQPVELTALARRLFTVRTLAWAGGVATALGVVLLYVMAAAGDRHASQRGQDRRAPQPVWKMG